MSSLPRARTLAQYQSVAAHGAVAAADPHRLVLMLMDGAMERIARARGCMEHGEYAEKSRLLHSAVMIVEELRASLDLRAGGEIAANLDSLYDYVCRRLVLANAQNQVSMLDEATHLLREIREAWVAIPPEVRRAPAALP